MHHKESRATLGGKLSAVLVAAGSSVGLGNIWRFPYVAGDNGGGAFLIIYILCVLLLGLPLMIAEFTVGRASHRNAVGAYRALNPRWSFLGYNGVLAAFLILGFYFVVSGWTAEYMVHSVTGSIARFSTAEQYKSLFENFISNPWRPVVYTCLFVLATHFVIAMGVQKGIERSAKILMPLLFLILIVLSVHSLLMPGGEAGLKFLFAPDFSKVTPTTVLVALGQAFFSLSVTGSGMIVYGAYLSPQEDVVGVAQHTALFDTIAAVVAALVIIPACFSYGLDVGAGPSLLFVTLPTILQDIPLGQLFAIILYIAMIFAGVSSLQNMFEAVAESLQNRFPRLSRTATLIILAVLCLGFGIGMETISQWGPWMDLVSIYIIPIGATLGAVSWFYVMKKDALLSAINTGSGKTRGRLWYGIGRYLYVPLAVILCCVALFMKVAF